MTKPSNNAVAEKAVARRMLTRKQAAEYLSISCATLSRWAADRTGPPWVKLGDGDTSAIRYPSDLLDDFIASRTKLPKA
jgi:predicted DNA-binding transcriptional regulator AlpA